MTPLFLALGLVLLGMAVIRTFSQRRRRKSWRRTTGEVRDSGRRPPDHWGGKTAYFPIIRFAGPLGKSVEFQSSTGTQFEHYKTGAAVPVLFNPEDPAEAVIDQFLMRRGPELWMTIAGVVLLLGSVVSALE